MELTQLMEFNVHNPQIKSIDTLRSYLHVAMKIEHATLPPYLTALYSIHPSTNAAATHVLRAVVVEEMLHLALAANLLNAVGGEPDLTRPDFMASYPAYLPDGEKDFQVHLRAFSQDTIKTFLKIEGPAMAPNDEKRLLRRPDRRGLSFLAVCPADPDLHYYSIGEFYREIDHGLDYLEKQAQAKSKTIFTGPYELQVTSEYYYSGGGKLSPVTDLASASKAVALIIAQGEGEDQGVNGPDGELAHLYRYDQLLRGRYYQPAGPNHDKPGEPTGPQLTVDWNAVYPIKTDAKLANHTPGSELHAAAVAFNEGYAEFLQFLTHAFNGKPAMLLEAVPRMFVLRDRVNQLMRNPLADGSGLNAAPTFEVGPASARRA